MATDFTRRAYDYFSGKGYSAPAAAALAANATHESGGSPTILEKAPRSGSPAGFGMMQWDPQRKAGLYKFAANNDLDPESEQAQLAYVDHELNTNEKSAGDKLRSAQDYTQATNAVLGYLRPQGYTEKDPGSSLGYVNRYNLGAQIAGVAPIDAPTIGPPQYVNAAPDWQMATTAKPPAAPIPTGAPAVNPAGLLSPLYNPYASSVNSGLGLMAAGQPQQPPAQQQPGLLQPYRPQPLDIGLPGRGQGLLG